MDGYANYERKDTVHCTNVRLSVFAATEAAVLVVPRAAALSTVLSAARDLEYPLQG